ncbi:MAG: TonB family protein [Deltaproteobacteria bacterium]
MSRAKRRARRYRWAASPAARWIRLPALTRDPLATRRRRWAFAPYLVAAMLAHGLLAAGTTQASRGAVKAKRDPVVVTLRAKAPRAVAPAEEVVTPEAPKRAKPKPSKPKRVKAKAQESRPAKVKTAKPKPSKPRRAKPKAQSPEPSKPKRTEAAPPRVAESNPAAADAPPRLRVGLRLSSTVPGGAGPAFAVGDTRLGTTERVASAPVADAPVAAKAPPPANRRARHRGVRTGDDDVDPPRRLRRRAPPYPEVYRERGLEDRVTVELTVGEDGAAHDVRLVVRSAHEAFNDAAREAAERERFRPAIRGGAPIPYVLRFTYHFRLST